MNIQRTLGITTAITGLIFLIWGWIDMASDDGADGKTAVAIVGGFILLMVGVTVLFSKSTAGSVNSSGLNGKQ